MLKNEEPGAQYKILSPFGPKLGVVQLNDFVINKMIELTDNILEDDARNSYGEHLAGQIAEEPVVDLERLNEHRLDELFNQLVKQHVSAVLNTDRKVKTELTSMWLVSQREHEYNPIHWHEGCTISCVLYLKIPEYVPRIIPSKGEEDGKIVFINNNPSNPNQSMETPLISFSPHVGDMFIFPSRLLHGVYPFVGEGERRSVSFNAVHFFDDEKVRKLYI